MHKAPSSAASNIKGRDVRSRYQRLFRKPAAVDIAAEVQDSSMLRDDSMTITGTFLAAAAKRGRTKNSNAKVSPILSNTSCTGNKVKSSASTITLRVADVSLFAR